MRITRNPTEHEGYEKLTIWSDTEEAGYCHLNRDPKYAPYRRLNIWEIQDLHVYPQFRQSGFATTLIQECENDARQGGCREIGISVGLTSEFGPAQRLYCKLGYLPDGQGITYDRKSLSHGEMVRLDDDLCLMMIKLL